MNFVEVFQEGSRKSVISNLVQLDYASRFHHKYIDPAVAAYNKLMKSLTNQEIGVS